MRFPTISSKICVSAAVFYSTFSVSKCKADDISGLSWKHADETIHIYRTEIPWTPIKFETERNHFAFMAWIAVLSVVVSVVAIVCICCVCWKFYPRHRSRQSSNAALVPPSRPAALSMQADHDHEEADRGVLNSRAQTGHIYGRGVVNFAFTGSLQDPGLNLQFEDGPPAYATVISEIPDNKPTNAPYPQVSGTKVVETPPPAYVTVAPFQ